MLGFFILFYFLLHSTGKRKRQRDRQTDREKERALTSFISKLHVHVVCKVTCSLPFSALALTDFYILFFIIYYFHKSVTYLRHGYLMKEEIINTRDDTFSF